MAKKSQPTIVGEDELVQAILEMIVEKFGDRVLTWEVAERALIYTSFKIKQAALFAPPLDEKEVMLQMARAGQTLPRLGTGRSTRRSYKLKRKR